MDTCSWSLLYLSPTVSWGKHLSTMDTSLRTMLMELAHFSLWQTQLISVDLDLVRYMWSILLLYSSPFFFSPNMHNSPRETRFPLLHPLRTYISRFVISGHKTAPSAGCVNVAVLMPVLAVAVLSCLLFVHLVIRRKEPKVLLPSQQRRKSTVGIAHPHAEQRTRSRDLLYNRFDNETLNNNEKKQEVVSIEMNVGSCVSSPTNRPEDNFVNESRRKRRSGFSNKSFRDHSLDRADAEVGSQTSNESKNSSSGVTSRASEFSSVNENKKDEPNGFYNKTYKNDSIDYSDGEVATHPVGETVGVDEPKGGKAKGFINKTYHSGSMDLDDGERSAQASGKSVIPGAAKGAQAASEEDKIEPEHKASMDTYF